MIQNNTKAIKKCYGRFCIACQSILRHTAAVATKFKELKVPYQVNKLCNQKTNRKLAFPSAQLRGRSKTQAEENVTLLVVTTSH